MNRWEQKVMQSGKIVILVVTVLSALPGSAKAQKASSAAAKTLLHLEDDWARALVRRDTAMFRNRLSVDFVYTENADVMSKDDVIKGVTGSDTVTWAANDGMKVHVHGSTAVVTGILAMKGRGQNGPFDKRYRFTDTWMILDGRWQIIAAQDYLITK